MFFCESCRARRFWPQSFHQSYGPCEVCGSRTACYDVPTKEIAKYDEATREYEEMLKDQNEH